MAPPDPDSDLERRNLLGHQPTRSSWQELQLRILVSWTEGGVQVSFGRGGATALHLAAICNYHRVALAQALLESTSTGVNAIDVYGMTPLHYAVAKGHADMVKFLLEDPKVDVNVATNLQGRYWEETPLHLAVRMERPEVLRALCSTPNLRDNAVNWCEKTPLEMCWDKELATGSAMKKNLLQRDEVKRYIEDLVQQQESFQQAASALLVGATLVATIGLQFSTFNLPPPKPADNHEDKEVHLFPGFAMESGDVLLCSVVFSFLAIICGITAVLPLSVHRRRHEDRYPFIREVVLRLRRCVAASSWSLFVASHLVLFHILYIKTKATGYVRYPWDSPPPPPESAEAKVSPPTIWVGWISFSLICAVFWIPLFGFPLLFSLKSFGRDLFLFVLSVFPSVPLVAKAININLLADFLDDTLWFSLVFVYIFGGRTVVELNIPSLRGPSLVILIGVGILILGFIAELYAVRSICKPRAPRRLIVTFTAIVMSGLPYPEYRLPLAPILP